MGDATNDLLQRVAASVLEESAFLLLDRVPSPEFGSDVIVADVTYSGPGEGTVRLTTTPALDSEAAKNMLATDDDGDAGPPAGTALSELTNIVAGVLVAELFGTKAVCLLGIPKVRTGPPPEWPTGAPHLVAFADEEGRFITIELLPSKGEKHGATT